MSQTITGETGEWEIVIGMEVHAQIASNSKLFSGASAWFGAGPNEQVSFVDAAFPGMLPVLNEDCVVKAIRTGLGLNAVINKVSVFERKNYFYPDLPQGYQISQFQHPIVGKGAIEIDLDGGKTKTIGITRLHLEQDAGKSIHDQHPSKSYIDLNRSGCALMEIVSEPDLRGPEEACAFISKLRAIMRYLGTCEGNMDLGSMRADVNVSVRKPGGELGTRCEIKNMNSIKAIYSAIVYEAHRQVETIEAGGKIDQETRLWDPAKGETRSMRSKEEAHDYRYFPDPDLLPLHLNDNLIDKAKKNFPELPDIKKRRLISEYGLSPYDAGILIADRACGDYYEEVAKGRNPKIAANWVVNELFGLLNKENRDITSSFISAANLGKLIDLIADGTISGKIAKDVFAIMYETSQDAAKIVEEKGLRQVTDMGAIEKIVDQVIAENPDNVAAYKSGKDKLFGFFVGQVMQKTQGKANPAAVNDLLRKKLG
jgi:aspartyl-tRNA(Asn)/glutamyl-tRNA(Gln) amidotransferase subunit B